MNKRRLIFIAILFLGAWIFVLIHTNLNNNDDNVTTTFPSEVTVATFNVLKPEDTSFGTWDQRAEVLGETMKASGADVIALNEVYYEYQRIDLEEASGYTIIKPKGSEEMGWSNAIAYNSETTKLLDSGVYFFENQYQYTQEDVDNGDIEQRFVGDYSSRTAIWALFETDGKKYIFIAAQTQVDRNGDINELQIKELEELGRQLQEEYQVDNVIFAGDFNEDNFNNSSCSPQIPTYYGSEDTLDYICSNNEIYDVQTINSNMSDHYLVYGKVILY